jgi:hypothetical protein
MSTQAFASSQCFPDPTQHTPLLSIPKDQMVFEAFAFARLYPLYLVKPCFGFEDRFGGLDGSAGELFPDD